MIKQYGLYLLYPILIVGNIIVWAQLESWSLILGLGILIIVLYGIYSEHLNK